MLTTKEKKYAEKCRIVMAKEFGVPPDDIDMYTILKCIKRGIKISVKNREDEIYISALGEKEKKMIHTDMGFDIIDKVIGGDYPFGSWASCMIDKYKKVDAYL